MQDGQPAAHSQLAIASAVAVSQAASRGETALGETGPAGVTVVDKDRELAGGRVQVGRHAADIPPVAGRDQREQPDRRVLGGVRGAGQVEPGCRQVRPLRGGDGPPDRAGGQPPLGQVEDILADQQARVSALRRA